MNKNEEIQIPLEPNKSSYKLYHRKYYLKTRKFRQQIIRWLEKYPIPLSVYEDYVDDDMGFVELQEAYLAIGNYVNLLKVENIIRKNETHIQNEI